MTEEKKVDLWALSDLRTPWCLHVVATLHIAEHIAAGKQKIGDLAAAAGCEPYALHQVLTTLVDKGIFTEAGPGQFELNAAARELLDPAFHLGLDLDGIGGRMAGIWSTMLSYVRTGRPAYEQIFGQPFFDDLERHPEVQAGFDALMGPAGHGTPDAEFELTGGWQGIRFVVDVGGGSGAMLAEILRRHPETRGTLVDLPRTAALAGETFQAAGLAGRATLWVGSFFDPLPAGADLYLLRKVLNDWPDREAAAILKRCAEAALPTGRVVVIRSVVPEGTPRPLTIESLLVGGRPRSLPEFRQLARQAGLEVIAAGQTGSGDYVVECLPASLKQD